MLETCYFIFSLEENIFPNTFVHVTRGISFRVPRVGEVRLRDFGAIIYAASVSKMLLPKFLRQP